jgi:hypothetical protein
VLLLSTVHASDLPEDLWFVISIDFLSLIDWSKLESAGDPSVIGWSVLHVAPFISF